jgi:ABC-type nitrate/sulfonate/bicarbonate transport system substrate-binding protein
MGAVVRIRLGFKAFDAHELAWHCVARVSGAYARRRLHVTLLDTSAIAEESLPPGSCSVACGAALAAWLRGVPVRVLGVAADRPMFWLHGRAAAVAALRGARIATYPAAAPPAHFLRLLLADAGLDPTRDVTLEPARDDTARLGLLVGGDVDAAVLSSAVPPAAVAAAGFREIAFFGDALRVPSTGLAVSGREADAPGWLPDLVQAFAESITAVHGDDDLLHQALRELLRVPAPNVDAVAALVRRCCTTDGRSPPGLTTAAVARMACALGVAAPGPATALCDFGLLDAARMPAARR